MMGNMEKQTFGFPTFTPLSPQSMRQRGFRGSDSFVNTDPRGWLKLFRKLTGGDNTDNTEQGSGSSAETEIERVKVYVHVFGGSMTAGNGCKGRKKGVYYDLKQKCAWQFRFRKWLQAAFPSVRVVHKSWAVASSDSLFALSRFRDSLEMNHTIDLALFDPSMNDRWTYHDANSKTDLIELSIERILRLASAHGVAVAYMSSFMGELTVIEDVYHKVCAHYGVPMLSYRAVVIDQVKQAFQLKQHDPACHVADSRSPVLFHTLTIEDLHPLFQTHLVVAQFVCEFFNQAFMFYTHESNREARDELQRLWATKEVSVEFGGGDSEEGGEEGAACHPIQSFFSSLDSDQQIVTSTAFMQAYEAVGWKYKVDYPGKPIGWVSEGASLKKHGKLLLPVVVVNGKVSVSYLKSYRNSGKFQVFLQPGRSQSVNFNPTSPERLRSHPNLIGCCVNPWQTMRGYVDTFDNSSSTSVIVTKTFQFDMSGMLNVVVQRVPLSVEEKERRGGDKVKIVAVRSC